MPSGGVIRAERSSTCPNPQAVDTDVSESRAATALAGKPESQEAHQDVIRLLASRGQYMAALTGPRL